MFSVSAVIFQNHNASVAKWPITLSSQSSLAVILSVNKVDQIIITAFSVKYFYCNVKKKVSGLQIPIELSTSRVPLWCLQYFQLKIYFPLSPLICKKTRSPVVTVWPAWFKSRPTACLSTAAWMDLYEGCFYCWSTAAPSSVSGQAFLSRA